MAHVVHVWNIGRIAYTPALRLQKHLTELYKSSIDNSCNAKPINDILLIVEHDPVYTVGIRNREYDEKEEMRLKALGAEFHRTNRGGLITFHGPGQLVAYPIMNLKNFDNPGVRCYVSRIEETIILMCKSFGIKAERSPHTGVWVDDNKICAIGIHASRYITSHGLALNCNTNLNWFKHIVPCGIEGKGVTSLTKELGLEMTMNRTIPHFLRSFGSTFKCKLQPLPQERAEHILAEIG